MIQRKNVRRKNGNEGFTLLELTIVLAILAAVAGTVAAAYDGISDKAMVGTSTFNDAALDSAMRTYKVLNRQYPDNMDSLLVNGVSVGSPGIFYAGLNAELTTNGTDQALPKLIPFLPTDNQVAALNNVGIVHGQYIASSALNLVGAIPNADFVNLDPSLGSTPGPTYQGSRGANVLISTTTPLCKVDTLYLRQVCGFSGGSSTTGNGGGTTFNQTGDVVVAFGIGSSASIVKNGISQAPYYAKAAPNEYGRFLAMFLVTRDVSGKNGAASGSNPTPPTAPPQNVPPPSSPTYASFYADLPNAQFLGILDGKGDGQDEEYAEYTGQKGN